MTHRQQAGFRRTAQHWTMTKEDGQNYSQILAGFKTSIKVAKASKLAFWLYRV